MRIFSAEQIRAIDAYTIKNEPIASVDLMERAAMALSQWFSEKFDASAEFVFLAGPGNNGGDAWALARILFHKGFKNIRFYLLSHADKISPDSEINRQRLIEETDIKISTIKKEADFPFLSESEWIVDALFGSGLSRPLDGMAKILVDYINSSFRLGVISIDIPSGLFSEENNGSEDKSIVKANITLSLQFPKLAFFLSENESYVGNWQVLPIGLHEDIIQTTETLCHFVTKNEIKELVLPKSKFSHKGSNGHALIIAGSYGMMGAAVLATRAALRSGAGLVTAHIPRLGYEIIQTSVPEAITSIDESDLIFTDVTQLDKYSAISIGPGIKTNTNTAEAIKDLLSKVKVPLIIDADGLNILAENKNLLELLPGNTILTPHPGEFDRLTQKHHSHYQRIQSQIEFSKKHRVIIILKGAHTSISLSDGNLWFNTSGNAGMAKGGSGDVLTGVLSALLAQGYSAKHAGLIAVFIHGLAGDLAFKKKGHFALIPTDIINKLGKAFKKIE
jgi:ADP-dependent NAD(P)H-hydrate dehydratase / NAD(P)H-hydrate epimerase